MLIFQNRLSLLGLSGNYLLFIVLSTLAIIFLTFNIFTTIRRAEANYALKREEQIERDELVVELTELEGKLDYIRSTDAKRNLAVDSYKMAEPGETLYKIAEPDPEVMYIEDQNLDPINLENNEFWWKVLVL